MRELTLALIVCGFCVFFSNTSFANGVEFEMPMFSKKVMDQGADSDSDESECREVRDEKGHVKQVTCGTDLSDSPGADLSIHSSDFARQEVLKFHQQRENGEIKR